MISSKEDGKIAYAYMEIIQLLAQEYVIAAALPD